MALPRLLVVCVLLLYQDVNAQSILANNALSALIKSSLLSQNQQMSSSPIILNKNMLNSPQIQAAQAQPQNAQTYTFPLQLQQGNVNPSEIALNPLLTLGNGKILAAPSQSNPLLQPGVASALQSLLTNSLIAQSGVEHGKIRQTLSSSNMPQSILEKAAAPTYRQRSFYSDPTGSGIQAQSPYPTQSLMSPQPQPITPTTYQSFACQAPGPLSEPRNEESKVTGLKSILPLLLNLMRENNGCCGCNRCNCCCCRCGCECRTQDNNESNDNFGKKDSQEMIGQSPTVNSKDRYKSEQNFDNRKTRMAAANEMEKNNKNGTAVESASNSDIDE